MTYDPRGPAPRSIALERRLRGIVSEHVTGPRVIAALILGLVAHSVATGETSPSGAASSTVDVVASIEPIAVAVPVGTVIGIAAVLTVIAILHEATHMLAIASLGADPTVDLERLGPFVVSGKVDVRPIERRLRFTYAEHVYISLAPLVLLDVILAGLIVAHLTIGPIGADALAAVAVGSVLAGPSPPDWASLANTPSKRWDQLTGWQESVDRHALAEGAYLPGLEEGSAW